MFDRCAFINRVFGCVLPHIFCDLHRTEVRTAHRTEVCRFRAFLRQGFIVKLARSFGIEREIELIFPAKFEARL